MRIQHKPESRCVVLLQLIYKYFVLLPEANIIHGEKTRERVNGPPVLQIAHHRDRQPVHRPDLLADRVRIQQGLRRMLADPVARVDDRLLAVAGRRCHRPRGRMTQHHHIRIAGQHLDVGWSRK